MWTSRTRVSVTVSLVNGHTQTTATIHSDPYVAVADAFRAMKQQLQPVVVAPRARALAFA